MLTRSMTGAMTPLDRIRSARIVPVVRAPDAAAAEELVGRIAAGVRTVRAALLAPRELRLTADGG
jgi:hypothetical protein